LRLLFVNNPWFDRECMTIILFSNGMLTTRDPSGSISSIEPTMSTRSSHDDDGETPLGATEMQALRRLAEPPAPELVPQPEELWASRYRILEPLGHGGMGDVFLARDILLHRLVALKVLRTTSEESFVDARRLLREARVAAQAEHPRIARVYDAGTWQGQSFIAMEYVRGQTLRAWTKSQRPTGAEVIVVLQQLLEGLQALHERGLVHRDLKPENIMVTPEGNIRILDLGVARRVPIADTAAVIDDGVGSLTLGFGVGTPGYMAPEQWRQSDIDRRADIFALGVVAYELIAAHSPFRGSTNLEIRDRTLAGDVSFEEPCWSEVPVELKSTIEIALARDRERRFQDVQSMVVALGPLFPPSLPPVSMPRSTPMGAAIEPAHESLAASAVGMSNRARERRRPTWWVIGGTVAVALGIFAGLRRNRPVVLKAAPSTVGFAASTFRMGLDQAELDAHCQTLSHGCPPEAKNETPSRLVTLGAFDLDVHEVTNEEFAVFLSKSGSVLRVVDDSDGHFPRFVRYAPRPGEDYLIYDLWPQLAGIERRAAGAYAARQGFESLPVTLVTWLGAQLYCTSLGKRLPTDAEWELAAAGLERRTYPWGGATPTCRSVNLMTRESVEGPDAGACDRDRKVPLPIMSAPMDTTRDGVFDLGGNVAEWVDDDARPRDEPPTQTVAGGKSGIIRGGAFVRADIETSAFFARTTARKFGLANNVTDNIGFRCAKSQSATR
jgi:formylglycine-generating enzyme required for sulfatase activity/predicted Ser/Thr protein kinase